MKILLIFVLVLGITLIAAYLLGWRNLGNQPPVVPQKLVAQMSVKPTATTEPAEAAVPRDPRADATCASLMQSVQNQAAIDSELDWLAGYIAARNTDGAVPDASLERNGLRTHLLALCAEFPTETLGQAADRIIAKLRP